MTLHVNIGLESLTLDVHVQEKAVERGFSDKSDKYIWGILTIECDMDSKHAHTSQIDCSNRRLITWLASLVYIFLSIASVLISATVVFLAYSPSPLVYLKTKLVLYGLSIVTVMGSMIIFETKLKTLFNDPISWGISDDKIHTLLGGMDSPMHIPHDVKFSAKSMTTSPILVWAAFCLLIASLIIYLVRIRRTQINKKYIYDPRLTKTFIEVVKPGSTIQWRSRRHAVHDSEH